MADNETENVAEVWRDIPSYAGHYQASSHGRIRSLDRQTSSGRRLKGYVLPQASMTSWGVKKRAVVGLTIDGKSKRVRVHALVAEAFLGPRPHGMEVRHLDDDALNNRIENIAYGTRSMNVLDQVANGRHNNARKTHCKNSHPLHGDNLYTHPSGKRSCRICVQASRDKYQERKTSKWSNHE